MEKIRILHIVPNMQQGGLENIIMNIYRNIDRNKVQFDFLVHYKKKCFFDDEINKLGGNIYRFTFREDNNIIKYIMQLKKFFKEHDEYNIVHSHMPSLAYIHLGIAKKYKIKCRIVHCHEASYLKTFKGYLKKICFRFAKYNANKYWACSTEAGKYLFNDRAFEIIPNSIDIDRFRFNKDERDRTRKKLNIENKLVIGHIGRFNLEKNHKFLVEIFVKIQKINTNSILLLIGTGELEKKIRSMVVQLGISDKVKFLGVCKDVEKLYNAMDIFVMPSYFEGLPVTGVEAQASGLKCIFSDTITNEVAVTDLSKFISLDENIDYWVSDILNANVHERGIYGNILAETMYNIKKLAVELEEKYLAMNKVD